MIKYVTPKYIVLTNRRHASTVKCQLLISCLIVKSVLDDNKKQTQIQIQREAKEIHHINTAFKELSEPVQQGIVAG